MTEHITGVNIPCVQLQIAMGLRLSRIADLRVFFGRDPEGTDEIDFDTATPIAPKARRALSCTAHSPPGISSPPALLVQAQAQSAGAKRTPRPSCGASGRQRAAALPRGL